MAAERIPMRKLREVIRLRLACGLSGRAIAQSCRLSVSTVSGYLGRIAVAKLGWPLPAELDDDTVLERLLFPDEHHPVRTRPELQRSAGVTHLRPPEVDHATITIATTISVVIDDASPRRQPESTRGPAITLADRRLDEGSAWT